MTPTTNPRTRYGIATVDGMRLHVVSIDSGRTFCGQRPAVGQDALNLAFFRTRTETGGGLCIRCMKSAVYCLTRETDQDAKAELNLLLS